MRTFNIQGDLDLFALDNYLKAKYPVKILASSKNLLELKIFGFYNSLPIEPIIFSEAIVSIKRDEIDDLTTVTFSLFTPFFLLILFFSITVSITASNELDPKNFIEFALYSFCFFAIFFLPGYLWAWFKHKSLIAILKKKN